MADEELVRFCGIIGQLDEIKGRKAIDIDDYLNSPPHPLLARREVTHPYVELKVESLPAMRVIRSLGYQMRASIQDLMSELEEWGKDYDLLLEGGFYGDNERRWNLYVNDEHFATIDADYGYDCFDESANLFKMRIAELIKDAERRSKIKPLGKQERDHLDKELDYEPMKWGRSTGLWCR